MTTRNIFIKRISSKRLIKVQVELLAASMSKSYMPLRKELDEESLRNIRSFLQNSYIREQEAEDNYDAALDEAIMAECMALDYITAITT